MSIINLSGITKVYRTDDVETLALENVNLSVERGEFISVMGPSGCGKSTLLNIIGLLDTPTSGTLMLDGNSTSGLKDSEMARLRNNKIGFVFQSFHLVNSLSVLDNVEMPLLYRRMSGVQRSERARQVLSEVGLSHRLRHFPSQLSGGQSQRVAIARAIVGNPEIILADEPTGNLDSNMGAEIMDIMHRLNQQGATIVMVTHDEAIARSTRRIVRFFDGRKID